MRLFETNENEGMVYCDIAILLRCTRYLVHDTVPHSTAVVDIRMNSTHSKYPVSEDEDILPDSKLRYIAIVRYLRHF